MIAAGSDKNDCEYLSDGSVDNIVHSFNRCRPKPNRPGRGWSSSYRSWTEREKGCKEALWRPMSSRRDIRKAGADCARRTTSPTRCHDEIKMWYRVSGVLYSRIVHRPSVGIKLALFCPVDSSNFDTSLPRLRRVFPLMNRVTITSMSSRAGVEAASRGMKELRQELARHEV